METRPCNAGPMAVAKPALNPAIDLATLTATCALQKDFTRLHGTFLAPERLPSLLMSATQSSVSSQGMLGWFQVTHASLAPSRLMRGFE